MRALIFELRPETLENEGLIEALNRQTDMIQVRYGIHVSSQMGDEPRVSLEVKEHTYWITREALHNIVKHARASQIDVRLDCDADALDLCISNNGIGFDTDHDYTDHLGLRSMSERATRLNADLTIISQPDSGTTMELHVLLR